MPHYFETDMMAPFCPDRTVPIWIFLFFFIIISKPQKLEHHVVFVWRAALLLNLNQAIVGALFMKTRESQVDRFMKS